MYMIKGPVFKDSGKQILKLFIPVLFLFSVMCCSVSGLSQVLVTNDNLDSLSLEFKWEKNKIKKAYLAAMLGGSYRRTNIDSSFYFGNLALDLAKETKNPKSLMDAYSVLMAPYINVGNYSKALELGHKALSIAKKYDLEWNSGWTLNHFGLIYTLLNNYEKALPYYAQQAKISIETNNTIGLGYAYESYGYNLMKLNYLDSAEYYTKQAEHAFTKASFLEPWVYRTFGEIEMRRGNSPKAIRYLKQGLDTAESRNIRRTMADLSSMIARQYDALNLPDSARYFAEKSFALSIAMKRHTTIIESADLLANLYETKDIQQSYRYLKIAKQSTNELYGSDKISALQNEIANEREREMRAAQEIEDDRYRFRQSLLSVGLFALVLVGLLLYRNILQRKKANAILQEQKMKVELTLSELKTTQSQLIQSEKMAGLGELTAGIAHEIQNPLNFVNNFSEVSKELINELSDEVDKGNYNEVKAIAKDVVQNLEKINHHGKRADAIVKGMLAHSRTSSGQKEPTDLNALCDEYLRLAYHGLRAKDNAFNAALKTDFDPNIGNINIVPQDIGRVLLNLINNAFYAVNERSKMGEAGYIPEVEISTAIEGSFVKVLVKDNGGGIPEHIKEKIFQPFFTTKPTGQGTGLGLSLSYDIVTKIHQGYLEVQTMFGKGSIFLIKLPCNPVQNA